MMKLTAIALEVADATGRKLAGVVAVIKTADGTLERMDITNTDGYLVFNQVPVPFDGSVRLSGAAQFYQQAISVDGDNVTLRIGTIGVAPDINLPPAVPFV
jgi:hypothetical protein